MLRARLRRVSVACDEAVENGAASTADAESDALAELHTLKGEARMLGLSQLSDLAHELESLLGERATRSDCSRVLRAMHGALDEEGARGEHAGEARERSGLEATLSELARHAEALARQLGKHVHVQVRIEGAWAGQLSTDALGPVLLHLLRNAVDHGLELPENRGSKPFVGRIALSVQASVAASPCRSKTTARASIPNACALRRSSARSSRQIRQRGSTNSRSWRCCSSPRYRLEVR